jgi:hypothetical protein
MNLDKQTEHPYYSCDNNFYSHEAREDFESVSDFLDEYEDADIDMNLCFRFDIKEEDESPGKLYVEIFHIKQRKGIYFPMRCKTYNPETEGERLKAYLKTHFDHLQKMWAPFSV